MKEKKERFGTGFIYFVLVLWFGAEVIFNSTIEKIFIWDTEQLNDHVAVIILIMLVAQIVFFQQYNIIELLIIGICSLPIVYATLNSNHNTMIATWIFIIAAKYIHFDTIIKIVYYVELVQTSLVIYLYESGIIPEYTMYRGSVLRHSLGFNHPNQLGIRIFLLVVCRCYIRSKKFNLFDWSLIIAAALFVDKVANSKTSAYALVIMALIMAFYELACLFGENLNMYSLIMIVIAAASNIASVSLSCIYIRSNAVLDALDKFMSRRFSNCYVTLRYYGFSWFGQEIRLIFSRPGIGKTYHFWLDNAYMSILLRYGVIVFALFSALYIVTMIFAKRTGQHLLVAILCLYAIYGIMENNFFSMSQNIFLLVLSYPIYKRNDEWEQKYQPKAKIKLVW